jgi:hypothetical protein
VAIQYLTTIFVSGDWFYEMVRERLLEVYTRDMVDRIFPFQKDHMFPFKNQEMVSDEELAKIGLSVPDSALYEISEEFIYKAYTTPQETMKFSKQESRPNSDHGYYSASNG